MFRPKPSEAQPPRSTRQKLESLDRNPTIDDVRLLASEAERQRGILIELAIKRASAPIYILACQHDTTASEPLWALYEGEDCAKTLWSCPNSNLEMIVEMTVMS